MRSSKDDPPSAVPPANGFAVDKAEVRAFWGALYHSLYDDYDRGLTRDRLLLGLDALEDMFRLRRHMLVEEMPLHHLEGRSVLEIGPGAGGHAALMAKRGAHVTAIDITADRARATAGKFALMEGQADHCNALQGDAEALPFADDSFDFVYSNGVLHHSPDTEKGIAEVHRVLKPGGRAVIMLYCRDSWHYWVNLVFFQGILRGWLWRDRNWVGRVTEWGGKDRQTVTNPITRCYSRGGMRRLFAGFEGLTLRKHEFNLYLIPFLGSRYRRWSARRYGTHPGGLVVYGEPWPRWSPLERWLGPRLGWVWYASAIKPER